MSKVIVVPYFLEVQLKDDKEKIHLVKAKVDSGADNCSIDENLAKKLGLCENNDIVAEADIVNANGIDKRPVIKINFIINDESIKTFATVADRGNLDCPLLIGRSALKNEKFKILIDPLQKVANQLKTIASFLKK